MKYKQKIPLPSKGIFWNLSQKQVDYFTKLLEKDLSLKKGTKQYNSGTNNIAWYSTGYYNFIRNKTSLPTYKWDCYFEEESLSPLIFN